VLVAVLIGANFLTNIVEKEIDPRGDKYIVVWEHFELFFNVAFTIELAINMYASWCLKFWKSSWNIFDFIVVSIGVLTTLKVPLPGPFMMLRMMRAFRVFRLFKRVKSLNKIMSSLARAVPGVMNAFLILLIVMCIYAILAVELFMDYGKDGYYKNKDGANVTMKTARELDYGQEYFGDFMSSLYTMFQVLTGESWSEAVARPMVCGESFVLRIGSLAFFCSFVLINGVVLINVVVAVLLEKMVDETPAHEEVVEDESEESEEEREEVKSVETLKSNNEKRLGRLTQEFSKIAENLTVLTQDMESVKEQLSQIVTQIEGKTHCSFCNFKIKMSSGARDENELRKNELPQDDVDTVLI